MGKAGNGTYCAPVTRTDVVKIHFPKVNYHRRRGLDSKANHQKRPRTLNY